MTDRRCIKHLIHFLSISLMIIITSPAALADTWYQVEVILVGYLNPADMDKENWPAALAEKSAPDDQVVLQYEKSQSDSNNADVAIPDLALSVTAYQAMQELAKSQNTVGVTSNRQGMISSGDTNSATGTPLSIPLVASLDDVSGSNEESANRAATNASPDNAINMSVSGPNQLSRTNLAHFPETFYPLTDDAESILDLAAARIARSRDMTVLAHYAWNEQIQSKDQALIHPVKIAVNKAFDIQVNGEFNLYKSRYIHLEGSLLVQHYEKPSTLVNTLKKLPCSSNDQLTPLALLLDQIACFHPESDIDIPIRAAQIEQSRRMRSDEIHYIDHPLMGILVTTRRIEDPRPSLVEPLPETETDIEQSTTGMTGTLSSMEISTSIPR